MRRKDREKDKDFALEVIDNSPYGIMAMSTKEGMPYCVPLSLARKDEVLYFHCAKEGTKTELLRNNNNVCVSFVSEATPYGDETKAMYSTTFASANVKGKATEVMEEKEKIDALMCICKKYTPEHLHFFEKAIANSLSVTAVWRIDIEEITGKEKAKKK